MKFSLIGPVYPFRGGIAQHTSHLSIAMEERGHEVNVFSFKRQYPKWIYPGKTDRDPSQLKIEINASYSLTPFNPLSWLKTANLISTTNPDLVIFQWWTTFWAPTYISLNTLMNRRGIALLYLIHNVLPHEERPLDRWLVKKTLGASDFFLVQSSREYDRLSQLFPNSPITLTPHPTIDFNTDQQISKAEAKKRLNIGTNRRLILFFGFVRPYKGLFILLEAVRLLRDWGHLVNLIVAGEFWESEDDYHRYISSHDLEDQIKFENRYIPNEEVGLYFSAADLFVAPHIQGTQSGAIPIAASFHLPIIATTAILDKGRYENSELIRVVPPADPDALAQAILTFIEKIGPDPFLKLDLQDVKWEWGEMVDVIESMIAKTDA